MKIRIVGAKDAGLYRTIRLEAVQDTPLAFAESAAEAKEKSFDAFVNYLDSHNRGDFVLGAFDEGDKLIGVVGFFRTAHSKYSHKGTIWGMYVRPAYRRQGVGANLISAAIEQTRKLSGVRQINLTVNSSNPGAKRLYEKAGFRVYGIEPAALNVDENYFDETLMQLVL